MSRQRQPNGFTLVETLVALTILAIALVGTWKLNMAVLRNDLSSHKRATATQLADRKLEELKATAFGTLVAGQQHDFCPKDGDPCSAASTGATFRREWSLAAPPIALPDTLQVAVRIGWGGKTCTEGLANCDHVVEFLTFVSQI